MSRHDSTRKRCATSAEEDVFLMPSPHIMAMIEGTMDEILWWMYLAPRVNNTQLMYDSVLGQLPTY